MPQKITRNSEPGSYNDPYELECPKHHQKAKVIVHYVGNIMCKTDSQKTYHVAGTNCSLVESTLLCEGICPILREIIK